MLQLRNETQDQVLRHLDQALITRHSFDAAFNNPNGEIIRLTLRDDPTFYFVLRQPQSPENPANQWLTEECPGRYFTSAEKYDIRDFQTVFSSVQNWVARVLADMAHAASANDATEIGKLREGLEQTANDLPNPSEPFTRSELDEWTAKFQRVLDRIEALEKENKSYTNRIDALRRELDAMSEKGTKVPKRTWLKTAGHKVLDLLDAGSKETVKALVQAGVKGLLGSDIG